MCPCARYTTGGSPFKLAFIPVHNSSARGRNNAWPELYLCMLYDVVWLLVCCACTYMRVRVCVVAVCLSVCMCVCLYVLFVP